MNVKQNITIRIADQPPLPMKIDREDEEAIRIAERSVNDLWKAWSARFKDKSSSEILSMVAFRYARLYFGQQKAVDGLDKVLEGLESDLDRAIETTK